jgi:hypothetical protein
MIFATITIILLSIGCLFAFWKMFKKAGNAAKISALLVLGILVAVYLLFLRDSMLQIMLIRSENTIIWGKWLPLLTGCGVGICFGFDGEKLKRVKVILVALLLVSYIDFGENFFPHPKSKRHQIAWLTLQSSPTTCSPAAVASLLRLYKIKRDEKQMINDCLTTYRGTARQGIWRGLKKNCPKGYKVTAVTYKDKKDIKYPILIRAVLKNGDPHQEKYSKEWGWEPGVPHSVVLKADNGDGTITVGDPSCGIENWNKKSLDVLWNKQGFRIVKQPAAND